jgi:hypothetical protein
LVKAAWNDHGQVKQSCYRGEKNVQVEDEVRGEQRTKRMQLLFHPSMELQK